MRLTNLIFSSVKSFEEPQRLPINPLTLIYGANSSGKSTILQTLLLLKQSAERAFSVDTGVTEFRGGTVDLGGFRTFVNNHDLTKTIATALVINAEDRDNPLIDRDEFFGKTVAIDVRFGYIERPNPEVVVKYFALSDERERHDIEFDYDEEAGVLKLANAASATAAVTRFLEARSQNKEHKEKGKQPTAADIKWLRAWLRNNACEQQHGWFPFWRPAGTTHRSQTDPTRLRFLNDFLYSWYSWVYSFSYDLRNLLSSIIYIGPLREFPRRVATEATDADGLGVRGERLVLTLARKPELVDLVNVAFKDLEIPYALKVEQVHSEKIQDALGDVAVAVLTDTRTGITVSPADVGFGLSQVLPIVVQLVGNRNSLIMIEQPEIHLHPRMQAKLADLLIYSATERNNYLIIETHSEHLLFRSQRRLREKAQDSFTHDSLGVFFVSSTNGVGSVQKIRIAENGEMIDPWPDGFFDDKLEDLFAGI